MTDDQNVKNVISSAASGFVVQAGAIHQLVLSAVSHETLPVPRQLPSGLRDFVGRQEQLAVLNRLLTHGGYPVVAVLDGTGGCGKTTLAVEWAHRVQERFPDGTLFFDLRGYGPSAPPTPTIALTSFLTAFGVPETRIPMELDAQAGLYRSVLAGRRVLILLDNAADVEQVRPLLPGAPGCMVVVTSRAALTELVIAVAAHRISLDLFTAGESQALLEMVLGRGRAGAEPDAVADLVRVCAGLPLAVRIAATRATTRPQLGLADVVADITEARGHDHSGFSEESGHLGEKVWPVFGWSCTRLSVDQARVFRRLGMHPGLEFGIPAAAALAGLEPVTVHRCLEVLADLHLVEPAGLRRYRLHDLLHAYAAHLAELDDTPEGRHKAVTRMFAWYTRTAQHADRAAFPMLPSMPADVRAIGELSFADRKQGLSWLRAEYVNLVAVLRHAVDGERHEIVMALASASRFLSFRERAFAALHIEVTSLGVSAAQAAGNREVEAILLNCRGETQGYLGQLNEAEADFIGTLDLADNLTDPYFEYLGLCGLGRTRLRARRLPEAKRLYQQALSASRSLDRGRAEAVIHANLNRICVQLGKFGPALVHAERELVLRCRAGDRTGEAYALTGLALAWQGLGEPGKAIGHCRRAVSIYQESGDIGDDFIQAVSTLASLLEQAGDYAGAAIRLREILSMATLLDDAWAEEARQRLTGLESRLAAEPPR